ncbi:hypothetical protein VTL71DRAFT_9660 [Oculimacula yallundae]|uniref:Uncharacterized protein n=1 Tax=Oculimacula yallundae TaxID=86028 RepID=A0ABR4BRI0_9HELO
MAPPTRAQAESGPSASRTRRLSTIPGLEPFPAQAVALSQDVPNIEDNSTSRTRRSSIIEALEPSTAPAVPRSQDEINFEDNLTIDDLNPDFAAERIQPRRISTVELFPDVALSDDETDSGYESPHSDMDPGFAVERLTLSDIEDEVYLSNDDPDFASRMPAPIQTPASNELELFLSDHDSLIAAERLAIAQHMAYIEGGLSLSGLAPEAVAIVLASIQLMVAERFPDSAPKPSPILPLRELTNDPANAPSTRAQRSRSAVQAINIAHGNFANFTQRPGTLNRPLGMEQHQRENIRPAGPRNRTAAVTNTNPDGEDSWIDDEILAQPPVTANRARRTNNRRLSVSRTVAPRPSQNEVSMTFMLFR